MKVYCFWIGVLDYKLLDCLSEKDRENNREKDMAACSAIIAMKLSEKEIG